MMKRDTFFKAVAGLASVPAMAAAIALTIQKPASAISSSLPTAETTQSLEPQAPVAPAELISRYSPYTFRLTNGRSRSIYYFYASPSNIDSWESDLLGSATLSPSGSTQVYVDDNRASCYYDFKAVFSDGASSTHYGIDICNLSSYTF